MADATNPRPVGVLERFERFLDGIIPPSDEVTAMARRAESLLSLGDARGALRLSENALSAAPLFLRALACKADALSALGYPHDALAVLLEAGRDRALTASLLARMSEYAAMVGDGRRSLEYAAQCRSRVRERDGGAAKRLLAASRALAEKGEAGASLGVARAATLVDPTLGAAWVPLAADALARGDSSQAKRAAERAAGTVDPTDVLSSRALGELFLSMGALEPAAKFLRRAWLVGDQDAVAPLVVALSRIGDRDSIVRVIGDAEGPLARTAKALFDLAEGSEEAKKTLLETPGGEVPEALWPLAVEVALATAPEVAERWAAEAPSRPGALAITALAATKAKIEAGDFPGARDAVTAAFADDRTRAKADALYREACRLGWRQHLAVMLEELSGMLRASPSLGSVVQELRVRRRELDEPLRVAILGEFSAGKSTFLNAMVGAKISPMGVLPTTANVHWLRHGEPGAKVVDGRGSAVMCTIDEAPRVVERTRAAGSVVDYVEVTWGAPRLARLELIDTPGFNAGEASHEAAVRRAFEIADVALWLFDARQAGKASETGPLEEARAADLPVIAVLNKIDAIPAKELHKLVSLVRDGFSELAPLVMSVSAREALAAVLVLSDESADEAAKSAAKIKLAASGFASLLAYLDEHLVAQRAAWKQLRVARRAGHIVAQAESLLASEASAAAQRDAQRETLFAAVGVLRESLPAVLAAARKEVAAVLREQVRGLEGRRDKPSAQDASVLAADAAAEVGYRVRQRVLAELAPGLREVERLAVEAGVLPAESASLATAPVVSALDLATAEGVRDAASSVAQWSLAPSDPFVALEQAITRRDARAVADEDDTRLRAALEVAREELRGYEAPLLPV